MPQPNSSFSELASITINNYSKEFADNVTNHIPLLKFFKSNGSAKEDLGGGVYILENLMYGDNAGFQWFNGYETLSVAPTDAFTAAQYDWKEAYAPVVFSNREVLQNSGEEKQFDLIENKTKNAEFTLANNIGASLFYSNTESDGKAIGGLQHLVADDPTTGTVGGINRATAGNEFWRNQIYDFSVESVTPGDDTIIGAMNTLYRRTMRNSDTTNLIVGGDTYIGYFEDAVGNQQRFVDTKEADASFPTYRFKNAKVFYDGNCSATRMYFLNTRYLKFKSHKDCNMVAGEARLPVNQQATVIPITWMGNLTMSNASLQGVMHA